MPRYFFAALLCLFMYLLVAFSLPFSGSAAALACERPDLSIEATDVFWSSYSDYLMMNLSVRMVIGNNSAYPARNTKLIGSVSSNFVICNTAMPINIGDLSAGSTHAEILKYTIPGGVTRYRLLVYVSAQDECGNTYEYPAPYSEANPNATTAGSATAASAGDTSINISMPYTGDNNQNNIYAVKYKLSADSSWLEWGVNPKSHSASPYTGQITGLTPGGSYDIRLTYIDTEGVFGTTQQTISGIVLPIYIPAAPTAGTASALSTTSIRWSFSDNSNAETGFKLHDGNHAVKASAPTPNISYLDETGLTPNTQYTRHVHAYNTAGDSTPCANVSAYTLPLAPSVTADKSVSTWYSTAGVTFTNAAGFGAGGVGYYRYAFDQSPAHTFTGTENQWTSGTLTGNATSSGSWYLHVKAFNGDGAANGTADYGPYFYDPAVPGVTAFNAATPSTSLDIPIAAFTASDNVGVNGYKITTSSTPPSVSGGGWSGSVPASYTVTADGTYTLYPWAKDAAGNVSAVFATPRTVIVDTTKPSVSSTTPASGATGVALGSSVTINFSENLNCSTVNTSNITISSGGWALSSCSGAQAVFATVSQAELTAYTVTVGTAVKDANGNPMAASYVFSYTTVALPHTYTVCASGCDFSTIQGAINDPRTVNGGAVLVSDGTYSENINLSGKSITVESVNGAESTIIRGNGANAPVVGFSSGETSAAVLEGFTIDNQAAANSATRGIYINGASPEIRNCIVKGNATGTSQNGGGIYTSGSGSAASFTGTTVSGNSSGGLGGGIYAGGGAQLTFSDGSISLNQANSSSGGGIAVSGSGSALVISKTYMKGNSAGQYGGGLYSTAGATVTNCTVSGNITTGSLDGGGIYNSGTLNVMNSTIAGNYSAHYGGGIRHQSGTANLTNSIIWGNTAASSGPNISGSPAITYSDIEGGYTGTGNINVEPLFYFSDAAAAGAPKTSGDYHVQLDSGVVDQGTTTGAPADDIDGEDRPLGVGIDMGSDEKYYIVIPVPGGP